MPETYDSDDGRSRAGGAEAVRTLGSDQVAGMWPVLRPGDSITLETAPRTLRRGDLLFFDAGVRRLVWVDPYEGLWVATDSMTSDAERYGKDGVRGRIIAIVRDGVQAPLEPKRPSLACYVEIALALKRLL
jgi:hypothetical protein